jgi:hypothetical protein
MLLKLIKIREMNSGAHCEVWEANLIMGDNFLAKVFVLNEHLPLELIYRLTVSWRGICIQGRHCGWQWDSEVAERMVTHYLEQIQSSREEIRIEVCRPKPHLPGYPAVDYHPDDYPIVLLDDLEGKEKLEDLIEDPEYEV